MTDDKLTSILELELQQIGQRAKRGRSICCASGLKIRRCAILSLMLRRLFPTSF